MLKIGDIVKRVWRESAPETDCPYVVERFNPEGTKVVLRSLYKGKPSGKASAVKLANIKPGRPMSGTFNATFYIEST